jgi:chemotaxis protein histidine kinase CheA
MPESLTDYFASEANQYLDQLDRLLALPGVPDADHLMRLATGVHGSARMAKAEMVAGVARRLEDAARSILSNNISWSEDFRILARQTVEDLRLMLRALNRWGAEEERRVREAVDRWNEHDGQALVETPARLGSRDLPLLEMSPVHSTSSTPEVTHVRSDASVSAGMPQFAANAVGYSSARGASSSASRQASTVVIVPIATLFFDDGRPGVVEAEASRPTASPTPVAIETLLLRGEAALAEALALRPAFESIARSDGVAETPLAALVDELFDHVELGRTPDDREA